MAKRLCDLFELVENNKDCAVFTVKPETSPLDLVKLGGFEGHECMFRMSKDPSTTCITIFREGDVPYHMNYGSSTTLVGEDRRKVRDLVMECVNLYYGIFTHGGRGGFNQSVEATLGARDPNLPKNYELQRGGDRYSLFVNDQHITVRDPDEFETWLQDKGLALEISTTRTNGRCSVDYGKMVRTDAPEKANEVGQVRDNLILDNSKIDIEAFGDALDKCFDKFLDVSGWRGMDSPSVVIEFIRFAKQELQPSLDDLMIEAKGKVKAKNTNRDNQSRQRNSSDLDR